MVYSIYIMFRLLTSKPTIQLLCSTSSLSHDGCVSKKTLYPVYYIQLLLVSESSMYVFIHCQTTESESSAAGEGTRCVMGRAFMWGLGFDEDYTPVVLLSIVVRKTMDQLKNSPSRRVSRRDGLLLFQKTTFYKETVLRSPRDPGWW